MNRFVFFMRENYGIIAILFFSALLRFYHIDYQSLWVDEITTIIEASPDQSFKGTYESLLALDLQPPLYFYILKFLFIIFGYTPLVMKSFSAALGVAGIWAIYLLAKELFNKKAGFYAAILLSVNIFHIHYSQEARPYAFLFLFTALSFYRFLIYIKSPSYKNAIYYGVFVSLMLYGHPYGLFSVFAQYLILAYYFFNSDNSEKWQLSKHIFVSGIVSIIFYLPALPLLINATEVRSFWISLPGNEVYTNIFKEFFGQSEFILIPVYLLLIFLFIRIFNEKEEAVLKIDVKDNSLKRTYFIIIVWLAAGTLIPFIRSYTSVPMIVPRYLIGLLPAVITLIAISIALIGQSLLRNTLVMLLVLFSLTDLFVVKNYYTKINKSQFREVSEFIKVNSTDKEPIVSNLKLYYTYYLDTTIYQHEHKPLNGKVGELMKDSSKIRSFWYADGHTTTTKNLSVEEEDFLAKHYYVAQNINLYGAWAIKYVPITENGAISFDLNSFNPLKSNTESFIPFFNNSSTRSTPFVLDKGFYTLTIGGKSLPEIPLNGINAHITAKIDDKVIGGAYLSEKGYSTSCKIDFYMPTKKEVSLELLLDNDLMVGKIDRNAFINAVYLEKKK